MAHYPRTQSLIVTILRFILLIGLVGGCSLPLTALGDSNTSDVLAKTHSKAESQLLAALGQAQNGDYGDALSDLSNLISEKPNFKLAQLVYGELMIARAGHGLPPDLDHKLTHQRNALLDEAKSRWAHRLAASTNGEVPASIIQLAPQYKHVVVADLSSNRVYLFENQGGVPHLIGDYYSTIGKGGAGKQQEGDMRTPVGIYHITRYINDAHLPELYGTGALPISYPNAYDESLGRTGHGIWLHGVPRATYSRTPRDSEGCVVLSNDDFQTLYDAVKPGKTPVIMARHIQWVSLAKAEKRRQTMLATLSDWRQSWESINTKNYLAYYSPDFVDDDGQDKSRFAAYKRRVNAAKTRIDVDLSQISIFNYPGNPRLMKITFDQAYDSNNYSGNSRKTQYWKKNDQGDWQILLSMDSA